MIKRKWLFSLMGFVAVLWIAVIGVAKWIQHGLNRDHSSAVAESHDVADPTDLKVFWNVPDFSFPDQDNRTVTNHDLLGHVWVADFIFTQCTSACPILTSKLMLIQKQVRSKDVRFVSFSVDPQHDTPAALKKYAQDWQGDESRWRLLSTDPSGLQKVCEGMKVTVAASGDANNPILHSNLFMLVDVAGKVRGIYDSSDSAAIARLQEDITLLAGDDHSPINVADLSHQSDVERGRVLFGSMGCMACHARRAVAPPVENLFGSMVRLDDRRMVWADDAYLHESIVDPPAKVVAGYTKSMPGYRNYLNDQQVLDLVAYIKSLSTNQPGGHGVISTAATIGPGENELLVDPVCGMQVVKDSSTPHADYKGVTYYFCSDACREKFLHRSSTQPAATIPAH